MEDDKTASWLVIITFLALAAAVLFAVFHLIELKDPNLFTTTQVF
jgi:hypothetical protein